MVEIVEAINNLTGWVAVIGKYRAKRIDNGEEIIGYPAIKGEGTEYEQCVMCVSTLSSLEYAYPFYLTDYEIDPSTIERVEDGCEFCSYRDFGDTPYYSKLIDGYSFYAGYYKQYDVDEFDEHEIDEIKFCPMCGKQLKEVEGK